MTSGNVRASSLPALARRFVGSYHFVGVVILFIIIAIIHYPQQFLWQGLPDLTAFLGLTRHSIERALLLIPVAYAGFIFGPRGGIAALAAASLIMLPRAALISATPRDALIESTGVIAIGGLVNLWFYIYRRDIAERQKTETALRESERTFRGFFESAPDAIWIHDMDGNITAANEATAGFVGYRMGELRGAHVGIFLPPESIKQARELKARLLQSKPVAMPYEQKIIRKDGTEAIWIVATNLIVSDGVPKAFLNIATDVTQERELHHLRYYLKEITWAQEEERKRIARELHDSTAQNLIALLHRLENFLNEQSKLPVKEAAALWAIHEHMREVLQEVRRFSRDLRPSILDDLGLLPALEWLTTETRNAYAIDASLTVLGTKKRLSQETELMLFRIVQEALNNTAKHAEASMAEVKVEFLDSKLRVTISDNGMGFSPAENTANLSHRSKLGLTGMQERAQLLGGVLQVKSDPGRGTTIIVEAPI